MSFKNTINQVTAVGALFALAFGSTVSIAPTSAHAGDALKTLAIGAGIAAIANELSKTNRNSKSGQKRVQKKTSKKAVATGPRATIGTFKTTRNEVFDYQTRLNKLGFETGTPDGSVGKNTRAGVRAFQASLGNEQTGRLNEVEAARLKILTDDPAAKVQTATAPVAVQPVATQPPVDQVQVMTSTIPLPPSMQGAVTNRQVALASPESDAPITLEVFNVEVQGPDFSLTENTAKFDILQVRTGDALDAALATLASEGVSNCQQLGEVSLCSMQDNPNDKIAIRSTSDALGIIRVTTIARHMQFEPPLPEAYLTSMLEENYSGLVSAPGQTLGSEGCTNTVGPTQISGAQIYQTSVSAGRDDLTKIAAECESFARLSMNGPAQGEIGDLFIVLFDSANLPKEAKKPTGLAKIKF